MYRECQQRAQAAMEMAIAAPADERLEWVQVALLWQFLGSTNDAGTSLLSSPVRAGAISVCKQR
jgi:hypothetical protein